MKNKLLVFAACAFLVACNGGIVSQSDNANNTPVEKRVYPIAGTYHELEVGYAFNVVMSDTVTEPSVQIAADLHDKVIFRIDEGTLVISLKPGHYRNMGEAVVLLPHNPLLDEIELSGASHFASSLPLEAAEVSLSLSGASTFEGVINASRELDIELGGASHLTAEIQQPAGSTDIELSGASTATLSGATGVLDMDVSGASNLNAVNLDAANVKGDVSGASTADVLCCQSVSVEVRGVSHLTYGIVADGCTPAVNCRTNGSSTASQR